MSLLPPSPTRITELCVNLDDITGQLVADACESLLREGALDVWTTAITMKKGRPGLTLSVLVPTPGRDHFAARILQLTGSFGVRTRDWDRLVLEREHITLDTPIGPVRIKVGRLNGRCVTATPEHEDVRERANHAHLDVIEAQRHADAAAARWLHAQGAGA